MKLELERGCGDSHFDEYGHFQPSCKRRPLKHLFIEDEEEEGFDCCFVIFLWRCINLVKARLLERSLFTYTLDPVCHKMRKTKSYFIVGFWYNDEFTTVQ